MFKEVSLAVANEQERGRIDELQFIEIFKDLATRPEIYFLMVRYANKDYLNTNVRERIQGCVHFFSFAGSATFSRD
jgi:hypothetical protein